MMRSFVFGMALALCAAAAGASDGDPAPEWGWEVAPGIGAVAGDLNLSGVFPPAGNRYEIAAPRDGGGWGARGAVRYRDLRVRGEFSTLDGDGGDLTDRDYDSSGALWAASRSDVDTEAQRMALLVGWDAAGGWHPIDGRMSLELGGGWMWGDDEATATRKRFDVPAQGAAPGVYLGETDGVFLDDSIETTGPVVYFRGAGSWQVARMWMTASVDLRFLPALESEFREVRYPDRPGITVHRAIDFDGDGFSWEAAVEFEPAIPYRGTHWFVRGGIRGAAWELDGNDLDSSYIDSAMENSLEIDGQMYFLEGGVRF